VQTYVDGLEQITLKHRLAELHLTFAPKTSIIYNGKIIDDAHLDSNTALFLKPSHAKVGHGTDIIILENLSQLKRTNLNTYEFWVLQEAIIGNPKDVFRFFCIAARNGATSCFYICNFFKRWGTDEVHSIESDIGKQMVQHTKTLLNMITSKSVASQLHPPGYDILGFDYIVDLYGKVWILEVNSNAELPSHHVDIHAKLLPSLIELIEDLSKPTYTCNEYANYSKV
jgi:hypothetical protein